MVREATLAVHSVLRRAHLPTHGSADRAAEAGSTLREELRNSRGLCWHEVLPFLKAVLPRAHAMVRLLCPHTQNLLVCKGTQHSPVCTTPRTSNPNMTI